MSYGCWIDYSLAFMEKDESGSLYESKTYYWDYIDFEHDDADEIDVPIESIPSLDEANEQLAEYDSTYDEYTYPQGYTCYKIVYADTGEEVTLPIQPPSEDYTAVNINYLCKRKTSRVILKNYATGETLEERQIEATKENFDNSLRTDAPVVEGYVYCYYDLDDSQADNDIYTLNLHYYPSGTASIPLYDQDGTLIKTFSCNVGDVIDDRQLTRACLTNDGAYAESDYDHIGVYDGLTITARVLYGEEIYHFVPDRYRSGNKLEMEYLDDFIYYKDKIIVGQPVPEKTSENGEHYTNGKTYKSAPINPGTIFAYAFRNRPSGCFLFATNQSGIVVAVSDYYHRYNEGYNYEGIDIKNIEDAYYIYACNPDYTQYSETDQCTETNPAIEYYEVQKFTVTFNDFLSWHGRAPLHVETVYRYNPVLTIPELDANFVDPASWWVTDWELQHVTKDIDLYLTSDHYKYKIRFFDNVDNSLIESKWVTYSGRVTFPAPPEHDGKIFDKWYQRAPEDSTMDIPFYKIDDNNIIKVPADFYALYKNADYTVTFYDSDGTTVLKQESTADRGSVEPPTGNLPSADYEVNWIIVPSDASYSNVKQSMTCTASYVKMYFYVRYIDVDGTVLKTNRVYYNTDSSQPAEPEQEHRIFKGWSVPSTAIKADTDIYAVYESDKSSKYVVKFIGHNSKSLGSQYVYIHDPAVAPTPPTIEGYAFVKWDKDFSDITADLTVTAEYKVRDEQYTVKFVNWNNELLSEQTVTYGHAATAPAVAERAGYDFVGWSVDFSYIKQNTTTYATFAKAWSRDTADIYSTTYGYLGSINMAIDAKIVHKLNGECTIYIKTMVKYASIIAPGLLIRYKNLFFYITEIKKYTSSGAYYIEFSGEHISYRLNDEGYQLDAFDFTGTASDCLRQILAGTGLAVGTVDYAQNVTLQVNKEGTTRRDILMQLVALCSGELEYNNFSIGIRNHIGTTTPVELAATLNVTDVSMTYNQSEGSISYDIALSKRIGVNLGDNIHISFSQLAIDDDQRISCLEWNPFNFRVVTIGIGDYTENYNDNLYTDRLQEDVEDLKKEVDNIKKNYSWGLPDEEEEPEEPEEPEEEEPAFKVVSCVALPSETDSNTIYLIQGQVAIY